MLGTRITCSMYNIHLCHRQFVARNLLCWAVVWVFEPHCLPMHLHGLHHIPHMTGLRENVPVQQLRQAQSMSLYAIAAYGLQNIAWGRGK